MGAKQALWALVIAGCAFASVGCNFESLEGSVEPTTAPGDPFAEPSTEPESVNI